MTLATDYVLAALGLYFANRLRTGRERQEGAPLREPRCWWVVALVAMSVAAGAGGTAHGFAPQLTPETHAFVWRTTMVAVGVAAVALVMASMLVLAGFRPGRAILALLACELALYSWWVIAVDDSFRVAVVQYGAAMLVALVVHLKLAASGRAWAWWIVAAVAVSLVGAAIQQLRVAPHPGFNHNDLYHVVQMFGLWLFYRGAAEPASAE